MSIADVATADGEDEVLGCSSRTPSACRSVALPEGGVAVAGGGLVETRCAAPLPLEGPARLRCVGGAAGAGRAWGGGRAAARVGNLGARPVGGAAAGA